MKHYYLGLDLGTSSVKLAVITEEGCVADIKEKYLSADPAGWTEAIKCAFTRLSETIPLKSITAMAISSQVGTYIVDDTVIGWDSPVGKEELAEIKGKISQEEFVAEIGMEHPDLISYPLPRFLYIKRHFPDCRSVVMPKEFLIQEFTGNTVTDAFSYRGLANIRTGEFSRALLEKLDIDFPLPTIKSPFSPAGTVTKEAELRYGLKEGMPVYVGCNDFFAGLLGMGVLEENCAFDLSGTSEHIGIISAERKPGAFVSGDYFNGCVTYGGTASSGCSCDFAINNFTLEGVTEKEVFNSPPIFLPYLRGERAPIFDPDARGVFFGINDKTDKKSMAYAVLEGVAFSLYHIGEGLGITGAEKLICGGGSSKNKELAQLKAGLFGCKILAAVNDNTSALGAALIAFSGFSGIPLKEAIEPIVQYEVMAEPTGELETLLKKRYAVYLSIYKSLKNDFTKLKEAKL